MKNATCIYLYEGTHAPVVFDTALLEGDRRKLTAWIASNPELEALVSRARELAEAGVTLDREASQQRLQRLFRLLSQSKRGATAAPKGQK